MVDKNPKMTFEQGIELKDKIIELLPTSTFILAFRVGRDLVSTLGGTKPELQAMIDKFQEKIDEL